MAPLLVQLLTPSSTPLTAFLDPTASLSELLEKILAEDAQLVTSFTGLPRAEVRGDDWGVRRVARSERGRVWRAEEMEGVRRESLLSLGTSIAIALNAEEPSTTAPTLNRQFSSFPQTRHLQSPSLRLVYHPYKLNIVFQSIPGIEVGGEWDYWFENSMTTAELLDAVSEELGIRSTGEEGMELVLQGIVDGVLTTLPSTTHLVTLLSSPSLTLTTTPNWSARFSPSKSSKEITASTTVNGSWRPSSIFGGIFGVATEKRLDLEEGGEREGGSTIKGRTSTDSLAPTPAPTSPPRPTTSTSTVSTKNRLSTLFTDWIVPEEDPTKNLKNRIVSGPVAIEEQRAAVRQFATVGRSSGTGSAMGWGGGEEGEKEVGVDLEGDLERLMDDLGMKGPQRNAMKALEPDRKRFLILQHQETSSPALPLRATKTGPELSNEGTLAGLKRFSLVGWAAGGVDAKESANGGGRTSIYDRGSSLPTPNPATSTTDTLSPTTPSLDSGWTSWWSTTSTPTGASSSHPHYSPPESTDTPEFYVASINSSTISQRSLVKVLIALRVRLSTSKLSWTRSFLEEGGLEGLEGLLGRISTARVSRSDGQTDEDETVQIECVKCLRVLMNTDIGFTQILSRESLITYIAYSLDTPSNKLRAQVSDLLAALCILSPTIGHSHVLSALSDFRIAHAEKFRFEFFLESLSVRDGEGEEEGEGEEGAWEWRTAGFGLINAIIHGPVEVRDRILLREEFGRRGLNEIMTGLRYLSPPDHLVTQLDLYIEKRLEDQRELSELSERSPDLAVVEEMEGLRVRVEELEGERTRLAEELEQRTSELASLRDVSLDVRHDRSRSMGNHDRSRSTETENLSGVIQSLVQKEKQILQLETEVASLSKNHKLPLDADLKKERLERSRQVSNLTEEIHRNKTEIAGLGTKIEDRDKEIKYLKRALESVYARFQTIINDSSATSTPSQPSTTIDPEALVNQTIEALKKKDEEIVALKAENTKMKAAAINSKRLPITFGRNAPPPPPPSTSSATSSIVVDSVSSNLESLIKSRAPPPPAKPIRRPSAQLPLKVETIPESTAEDITPTPSSILSPPATPAPPTAPTPPPFVSGPRLSVIVGEGGKMDSGFVIPTAPTPPTFVPGPAASGTTSSTSRPALPFLAGIKKSQSSDSSTALPSAPTPPTARPALPFLASIKKSPPPAESSTESKENPSRPALPFLAGIAKSSPPDGGELEVVRPRLPFLGAIGQPRSSTNPPPPPPIVVHQPLAPITPTSTTSRVASPRAPSAKKMKPFFWNKISTDVLSTSIWSDIDSTTALDLPDLELDFSIGAPIKSTSKPTTGAKKNVVSLLGLARANNVSIMLARFKMSHEGIRDAILKMDDTKVSIDNLLAIKHYIPTTDEIEAIRSFEGDITTLAASDQYFNQIMIIPRLGERLSCMIYRRKLEMDMEELKPELTILRSAADELKNSLSLKKLLATVLVIGNRLNASTFRGDAEGFQLESLLKLKETRATSASASTPTLLHYLARAIIRSDPSLFAFLETASHVEAASRISVSTVMSSVNLLVNGLANITEEIRALKRIRISPPSDRFITTMESFVRHAAPAIEALKAMGGKLDEHLKTLVRYYGEDSSSTKPEDVFGIIAQFSSALLRAETEIRAADKKSNPSSTKRPSDTIDESSKSIGRGGLDNAIRDLRSGNGLRRTRIVTQRPLSRVFLDGTNR